MAGSTDNPVVTLIVFGRGNGPKLPQFQTRPNT